MFVDGKGVVRSVVVSCIGFLSLMVAGVGCSSNDQPVPASTGGASGQGGSTSASTGGAASGGSSTADDAASAADAADWTNQCLAVTPPAPNCPCICRECAEVTARCFGSPDCQPILDCAQRTGCRSNVECLTACGTEISAHMAGVLLAQNFRACFNPMCAAACVLPDAATDGAPSMADAAGGSSGD